MRRPLEIFARQVLLFPMLVTLLASVSFLMGGSCAAWQWWVAVAVVMAFGFIKNQRDGAISACLFMAFLGIFWCVNHTMLTRACGDVAVYHMPATRALIAGWNPVEVSTPEGIASFLGVTVNDARFWMVISMAKTAWIFNAVAYFFTGDQMNLFFPVLYFFFAALAMKIWFLFSSYSIWVRIVMIVASFVMLTPYNMTVDVVIGVAGVGLLLGFWDVLRGNEPDWLSLAVFSFWMTTAKQLGALHCFIMWLVFASIYLRDWKKFRALSVFVITLVGLWFVATAAPYITNWKNYGHPLYPCYTVDAEKYPVVDLVRDFKNQNEDASKMGPIGRFVNAYVSSDLALCYYSWNEGRVFSPRAQFFGYDNDSRIPMTPTLPWVKVAFCGLFLFVMLFGRKYDRLSYAIGFVAFCAVPLLMIGYVRYTPWLFWSVLPLLAIVDRCQARTVRVIGLSAASLVFLPGLLYATVNGAELVDFRYAANKALAEQAVCGATPVCHVTDDGVLRSVATLKLSAKAYNVDVAADVVKDGHINFYTDEFQVETLPDHSYFHKIEKCTNRAHRMCMYGNLVLSSAWKFIKLALRVW